MKLSREYYELQNEGSEGYTPYSKIRQAKVVKPAVKTVVVSGVARTSIEVAAKLVDAEARLQVVTDSFGREIIADEIMLLETALKSF